MFDFDDLEDAEDVQENGPAAVAHVAEGDCKGAAPAEVHEPDGPEPAQASSGVEGAEDAAEPHHQPEEPRQEEAAAADRLEAQPVSVAPGHLDLAAGPLLQVTGEDLRAAPGTEKAASARWLRQPTNAAAAASVAEGAVRLAVNSQYVCYVDAGGTKVQVISVASGSPVVAIDSHEAKVVDMAVAPKDSHLLVAFGSSRVELHRLPQPGPSMLLAFDRSPQAVEWHPGNPKVFLTLHENCVLLWHLQSIVHYIAMHPPATPKEEREAKSQLFVSAEVKEAVACKASADQLAEGLQRMAMTPDGCRLAAISGRQICLWSLRVEETWPAAVELVGTVSLEQAFASSVLTLRVSPCAPSALSVVAACEREVTVVMLQQSDTHPPVLEHQQMICFPGRISADAFPLSTGSKAVAILARSGEGEAEDEVEALLQGELENDAKGLRSLSAARLPQAYGRSIGVVVDGLPLPLPAPCQQQEEAPEEPPGLIRLAQAPLAMAAPPGLPPPGLPPPPGLLVPPAVAESSDDLGVGSKPTAAAKGTSVQELAEFMKKRAERASDGVADLVVLKLPAALQSAGADTKLQSEVAKLKKEAAAGEEKAAKALRRFSDVEALQQTPGFKKIKQRLSEDLAQWKDPGLPQVLLALLESPDFADSFAEGLSRPQQAQSPLMQALRPTKQQLMEALKEDYKDWCGAAAADRVRELLQAGGLPEIKGAMDSAMKEVSAMYLTTMTTLVEDVRANAKTDRLVTACERSVRAAVQREVQRFEAELQCPGARRSNAPAAGNRVLQEGFLSRLRRATAPIGAELSAAEEAMAAAGDTLSTARRALDGADGEGSHLALSDSSSECLADRGVYKAYPGSAKPGKWS